jgi:hypothetical protein
VLDDDPVSKDFTGLRGVVGAKDRLTWTVYDVAAAAEPLDGERLRLFGRRAPRAFKALRAVAAGGAVPGSRPGSCWPGCFDRREES